MLRPIDAAHIILAALSLERPKDGNVVKETKKMAFLPMRFMGRMGVDGLEDRAPRGDGVGLEGCSSFREALIFVLNNIMSPSVLHIRVDPVKHFAEICLQHEDCDEDFPDLEGERYRFGEDELLHRNIGVSFEISRHVLWRVKGLLSEVSDKYAEMSGLREPTSEDHFWNVGTSSKLPKGD